MVACDGAWAKITMNNKEFNELSFMKGQDRVHNKEIKKKKNSPWNNRQSSQIKYADKKYKYIRE